MKSALQTWKNNFGKKISRRLHRFHPLPLLFLCCDEDISKRSYALAAVAAVAGATVHEQSSASPSFSINSHSKQLLASGLVYWLIEHTYP